MAIVSLMPFLKQKQDLAQTKEATIERKKQFSMLLYKLHHELIKRLDPEIEICAKKLGLMRKGLWLFDDENEMITLMDYAIYNFYPCGRNVISRFLEESPPPANSDEMRLLRAMQAAYYSIFEVIEVKRGLGLEVLDMLRMKRLFVVDYYFSLTVWPGTMLAGRILPLSEFNIFSGAALPVLDVEVVEEARKHAASFTQAGEPGPYEFSPRQDTELATVIIRMALVRGAASQVEYVSNR